MNLLLNILPCLGIRLASKPTSITNEKDHLSSTEEMCEKFLQALVTATEPTREHVRRRLRKTINAESWTEDLALRVLVRLQEMIESSTIQFGPALHDALDKAKEAADEVFTFARDHPVAVSVFFTILAIGVLWAVSPWVLGILGFAEEGPIAGKRYRFSMLLYI